MSRLQILEASLAKKQELMDSKIQQHFDTVRQANGQPLNDKRCGRATLKKWERQNDAIRSVQAGIEVTKAAIEKEKTKLANVGIANDYLPKIILDMVAGGELVQWRKFPDFFFVSGVDKARIHYNKKTGLVGHRFLSQVTKEQYPLFRDAFNKVNRALREMKEKG